MRLTLNVFKGGPLLLNEACFAIKAVLRQTACNNTS